MSDDIKRPDGDDYLHLRMSWKHLAVILVGVVFCTVMIAIMVLV